MSGPRGQAEQTAAIAAGLFVGEDALPTLGRPVRLSYVGEADRGARDSLFPSTAILVQPCEAYQGAGYYQLLSGQGIIVRRCFQMNAEGIRVVDQTRAGAPDFTDLTLAEFGECVCGLVLAELHFLNNKLECELLTQRRVQL